MEIEMRLTKSTKNTHVYGDNDPATPVPTLYIKKEALPTPPPGTITVTIKLSDER